MSSKIVGFTASTFDLLHAGHVSMLREAKEQCDYLICGLQVDPSIDRPEKNKPVQTLVERYTQLAGIKYVDEIIPYQTEEDLEDILKMVNIDLRIIGSEYKDKTFTGRATCAVVVLKSILTRGITGSLPVIYEGGLVQVNMVLTIHPLMSYNT